MTTLLVLPLFLGFCWWAWTGLNDLEEWWQERNLKRYLRELDDQEIRRWARFKDGGR